MKRNILSLWFLTAITAIIPQATQACTIYGTNTCCESSCSQSKNTWLPHAFSADSSREITLEKTVFQTESSRDEWNGTFAFAAQYMQNFGAKCNSCKNLGSMPFWGLSGTNTMTIGNNDGKADIDAYNFGLGDIDVNTDGIGGTISMNPKITQAGGDMLLYFVHKKDEAGMYFKVHAPIAAMIVDPQLTESGTTLNGHNLFTQVANNNGESGGTITYNTNYPGLADRYTSVSSAFAGGAGEPGELAGQPSQIWLSKGKIASCKQTAIRMADLSFVLGYNVVAREKGFLGIGFKTTCPTGNVPTATYMLEPIVGRGGYWGVGADVMGHYKAWENSDSTRYLDVWIQGEVLHLVPGRVGWRSFDLLKNGNGSKYILIQYMKNNPDGSVTAGGLTQAINQTTLPVVSKISVEGSFALMLDFHCHNWNLAISGEVWGRTRECLGIDVCSATEASIANLNRYAVVGRQASKITVQTGSSSNPQDVTSVVPLCEPAAKINQSQNMITLNDTGSNTTVTFPGTYPTGLVDATVASNRIPAELAEALNICGAAAAKVYTGKVFAQFGYDWADARYTPNLSVIGGAEFTNKTNNAVSMWNVGLQGSINF